MGKKNEGKLSLLVHREERDQEHRIRWGVNRGPRDRIQAKISIKKNFVKRGWEGSGGGEKLETN